MRDDESLSLHHAFYIAALPVYYFKIIYEYNTAINNITAMIVKIVFNTISIFILY